MKNKKIIGLISILGVLLLIFGVKGIFDTVEKKEHEKLIEEVSHFFSNEPLKPEADIYSHQLQSDVKIKAAMDSNNYTFDNPYVLKNPYYISPLTAIVIFKTDSKKSVEVTVNGKKAKYEATKNHAIPIYGLIAGKQNEVVLMMDGKTKSLNIDTTDVENDLDLDIEVGKGINLGDDIYIITTQTEAGMYGFNTKGELVWRLTQSFSLSITELENGHLLLSDSEYLSISFSRKGLVEIDYLGKIYNVYDIEGGFHSDTLEMENGNIILASSLARTETSNDYIIEINPQNGKIVNSWDLVGIVNKKSKRFVENLNYEAWAEVNSINYDKKNDSLLIGLKGRNSVVSIDYKSKEINWIFGDIKYWNQDFKDYIVSYEGTYPMGAHSIALNSEGNYVLFDNAHDASKFTDSLCEPYINAYSSGKIFKIENMKATLISEFNDNQSFFSYEVSNYNELKNKNYLLFPSWQFPDGLMIASEKCTLNQLNENLFATLYELSKNQEILFKAYVPFGSFMVNKLNLYNENNQHFNPVGINYFSTLDEKIYSEIKLKEEKEKLLKAEKHPYAYEISENLFTLNAFFQLEDEVAIVLVGKDGQTYEYLMKAKGYALQPVVNLRGIKGTYAAFLVKNGIYYNMDVTYQFS